MRSMAFVSICLVVAVPVLVLFTACGDSADPYDVLDQGPLPGARPGASQIQVPILSDDAAKKMLTFKCTECHTKSPIKKSRLSKVEWELRVQRCVEHGSKIAPADAASLVNWLFRKYGN